MNRILSDTLRLFIPTAAAATAILGISYINNQQNLRMLANDPSEWLAKDAAIRIAAGQSPQEAAQGSRVFIESMDEPYLVVFDASGTPVAGSGYLHDRLPILPAGVLDEAKRLGMNRLTWEPEQGVREAVVISPVSGGVGGYVLAGRSLSETERNESDLTKRVFLGWLATMAGLLVVCLASSYFFRRRE